MPLKKIEPTFVKVTPGGNISSSDVAGAITELDTEKAAILSGTGSPQSVVTATVGTLYSRLDGSTNTTLYVKETGSGNTGWVAK